VSSQSTSNNQSQSSSSNNRMLPPLHLPSFNQTENGKSTSVSSVSPPNLKRLGATTLNSSMLSQFKSPVAPPLPVVPTQMITEFNDEESPLKANQSSSQAQSRTGKLIHNVRGLFNHGQTVARGDIQWGSEYRTPKYWKHLNTRQFQFRF
jgi:hypothetical protein